MGEEEKVVFTESKTAHRTINGRDISDEEWEKRLRRKLFGFPMVEVDGNYFPGVSKIKSGGPLT